MTVLGGKTVVGCGKLLNDNGNASTPECHLQQLATW